MNPDQFKAVERLFDEAIQLEPEQRATFLQAKSNGDTTVRRQVQVLLDRHDEPHALLDANANELGIRIDDEAGIDDLASTTLPERIGSFRILGVLGEGGMGVVYRARQENPDRDVALKVLRPGLHSHRLIRRFRQESTVLAHLQHPGIAQVYEAGSDDSGLGAQPFFAMELIDGLPILEFASKHELPTRARVELLIRICEAIQHAHQQGVIHRDLKPANILVLERDGIALPKILDFGIARAMGPDFQTTTLCTEVGQLVGTLAYMSPEQAAGTPDDIDTRSDVYALGALGYELFTGAMPLDVRDKTLPEAVRIIQEDEPTPLGSVSRVYHGDLETIVGKAMDKDKSRRYQSANELAEDLRRYLTDEPIIARPASALYQLRKFTKRNKTVVISTCLVFLVLVIGVAVSTTLYLRSEARAEALRRAVYGQNISLAQHAYETNEIGQMQDLLAACPEDLRGWEWRRLRYLSDDSIRTLRGHTSSIYDLDFSPDGRRLASAAAYPPNWPMATRDRSVRVWDVQTGEQLMVLNGHRASVNAVQFSPDGSVIGSVGGTHPYANDVKDFALRFWSAESGELIREFPPFDNAIVDLFLDNRQRVYVAGEINGPYVEIRQYDWTLTELQKVFSGIRYSVTDLDISIDGSRIAASGWDDSVHVWEVESGRVLFEYHHDAEQRNPMLDVAFSPDARFVAVSSQDQMARVWDIESGEHVATLRGHDGSVNRVEYLPDGESIATAGADQTVRVWDAETGEQVYVLRGARDALRSLAVSTDGRLIAAAGNGSMIRIWEARPSVDTVVLADHTGQVDDVDWTTDGSTFVSASIDLTIGVWDAASQTLIRRLRGHPAIPIALDISPLDETFASVDRGGFVLLWDFETGDELRRWLAGPYAIHDVTYHPSSPWLATCGDAVPNRLWHAETGEERGNFETGRQGDRSLVFSPEGDRLYGAGWDGTLRVWQTGTGSLLDEVKVCDLYVNDIVLSPDGTRIAVGEAAGFISVFDRSSFRLINRFQATTSECLSVAFSPDGTRLVTTGQDMRVKIFDAERGDHLLTLIGHEGIVTDAEFDPSGRTIISCGADSTVRIWPTERQP